MDMKSTIKFVLYFVRRINLTKNTLLRKYSYTVLDESS